MKDVVRAGIRTCGDFLAARLQKAIAGLTDCGPEMSVLDITLYRDDWTRIGPAPVARKTELPFSLDAKRIILIDDVLYTGRTARATMDALMDYGRPRKIELAVLVDRGKQAREVPMMVNYVGRIWDTAPDETIHVYLKEQGLGDHVTIEEKKAA